MPVALRARLARASVSRTVRRVGENDTIPADARLVLVARDGRSESDAASIELAPLSPDLHVLALESGHQSRTAARLGIDRRTLYRRLKQCRSE